VLLCPLKGLRINNSLVAMSIARAQILVIKYHSLVNQGSLKKWLIIEPGWENIKTSGAYCSARK
jgi:hypothetical protein